jgi:hypothetical protein
MSRNLEDIRHPYLWILLIVGIVFLVGSNQAWWKHRVIDGKYWVYSVQNTISYPFMWQYDLDAQEEFEAAQFFPNRYKDKPILISRPLLQMTVNGVARALQVVLNPMLLSKAVRAWLIDHSLISRDAPSLEKILFTFYILIGFILTKLMLFFLGGVMMYELVREYSSSRIGLLAVALLFVSGYAMAGLTIFHTYEFSILTPIIVVFLYNNLSKSYSLEKNIFYSIIIGALMLAKANYAAYLSILVFSISVGGFNRHVLIGVVASVLAHLVPWIGWTLYLEFSDMGIIGLFGEPLGGALALHPMDILARDFLGNDLVSETKVSGGAVQPGVDLVRLVKAGGGGMVYLFQLIYRHFSASIVSLSSLWLLLAIYGFAKYDSNSKEKISLFIAIFLFVVWIQALVTFPLGPKGRTLVDSAFMIYAFATFAIFEITMSLGKNKVRAIVLLILTTKALSIVLAAVDLPLVHPSKQIAREVCCKE